jgi:hypothetical protein
MDSAEVDYNDVGDYTIGGQRVMADFDDFAGGGQQWSPGQGVQILQTTNATKLCQLGGKCVILAQ